MPEVENYCAMLGITIFECMLKTEKCYVIVGMISCSHVIFFNSITIVHLPDSIDFDRSPPVDFDNTDVYDWHPRGDSAELIIFNNIFICGQNLIINKNQL